MRKDEGGKRKEGDKVDDYILPNYSHLHPSCCPPHCCYLHCEHTRTYTSLPPHPISTHAPACETIMQHSLYTHLCVYGLQHMCCQQQYAWHLLKTDQCILKAINIGPHRLVRPLYYITPCSLCRDIRV